MHLCTIQYTFKLNNFLTLRGRHIMFKIRLIDLLVEKSVINQTSGYFYIGLISNTTKIFFKHYIYIVIRLLFKTSFCCGHFELKIIFLFASRKNNHKSDFRISLYSTHF